MKYVVLSLTLGLFAILSGCNKNDDDEPTGPTSPYFFSGKIGGNTVILNDGDGFITTQFENSGVLGATCIYDYGSSILDFFNSNTPMVRIFYKMDHESFDCDDTDEFPFLFTVGTKTFSNATDDLGVQVEYTKNGGTTMYRSYLGDQTGSTFEITKVVALPDYFRATGTQKFLKVKGKFNCKVYNENNLSDVKSIKNATFSYILTSFD